MSRRRRGLPFWHRQWWWPPRFWPGVNEFRLGPLARWRQRRDLPCVPGACTRTGQFGAHCGCGFPEAWTATYR